MGERESERGGRERGGRERGWREREWGYLFLFSKYLCYNLLITCILAVVI